MEVNFVVPPCTTDGRYFAVDELNEFKNLWLKDHIRSVSVDRLNHLTSNYSLLRRLESLYDNLFQTRIAEKGYAKALSVKLVHDFECNFSAVMNHLHDIPLDQEDLLDFYMDDLEDARDRQEHALESIYKR